MSNRWIFFPAPVSASLTVATCSYVSSSAPNVRNSNSWVAGSSGSNSISFALRNDSFGAFLRFTDNASAASWLSSFSSNSIRITDASANVYEWSGGSMAIFASVYIRFPLTNWSGTLPLGSSTVELYS